jgi:ribosomal-protein-alanine acetyltransferase
MTAYSITPFKLTDMPGLLRLEQEAFESDAYDAATFVNLYLQGADTFLVVRGGTIITGYVAAYVDDTTGYIASIAVAPSARGNGMGKALMVEAIKRLTAKGAKRVGLHVRKDNAAAIHLYEKLGFVTRKVVLHYYEDDAPALYMERRIG